MFPPQKKEISEEDIVVEELPEEEKVEAEEVIKEIADICGVKEEHNAYYNKIKQKQNELIECIETSGAKDKHGKPCGFRRA